MLLAAFFTLASAHRRNKQHMACHLMPALHSLLSTSWGRRAWPFSTATCLVVRAQKGQLCLPAHRHQTPHSRTSWVLDLTFHAIRVRAFGSLNGTSDTGTL